MPPKVKDDADFKQLCENVNTIIKQLSDQSTKLNEMEDLLRATQEDNRRLRDENTELRTSLAQNSAESEQLRSRMHSLEMHNRSYSVRIHKFKVTGDESDLFNVRNQIYNGVFLPILEGAKQAGKLDAVPGAASLIEMAHVLPGKEGATKPIICRFFSRILKGVIMTNKKDFASREGAGAAATAARQGRPPPMRYPIVEDLTKETYRKMVEIGRDGRVASCWSVGGHLRFRLNSDPNSVKKVVSVFDTMEEILG